LTLSQPDTKSAEIACEVGRTVTKLLNRVRYERILRARDHTTLSDFVFAAEDGGASKAEQASGPSPLYQTPSAFDIPTCYARYSTYSFPSPSTKPYSLSCSITGDQVSPLHATIRLLRSPIRIFAVGLAIRLAFLARLIYARTDSLSWEKNEPGGIARWILLTHSFSSPYHGAHFPTAWLGPGYPALVALSFAIFGVQSSASAVAVMIFNAVCSALIGVICYRIGKLCFDETSGLIAGWAWTLSPYVALMPFLLVESCLSALLLSYALLCTLTLDESRLRWAYCGGVWGIAALVNPALLAPLPFIMLYFWFKTPRRRVQAFVFTTAFAACVAPWMMRNAFVMHRLFPIRSNLWAEIYFGNADFGYHPLGPSMEYQRLGEMRFMDEMKSKTVEYVRAKPRDFVIATGRRVINFWALPGWWSELLFVVALAGLFLSRNAIFCAVVATYPLVYYVSYTFTRYRYPIEPVIYLAAGYAVARAWSALRVPAGSTRESLAH